MYGSRYQCLNLHSLLHLPDVVRDLGPLWAHSCFAFESLNGDMLKLIHGTRYIELQIASAINVMQVLPSILDGMSATLFITEAGLHLRSTAHLF